MDPSELHMMQMGLEGLRLNGSGHLERWRDMPGSESGPPPLLVAADYGGDHALYFAGRLDPGVEASSSGVTAPVLDGR